MAIICYLRRDSTQITQILSFFSLNATECPFYYPKHSYIMTKWITQNRITQQMKSIAKQRPPHLFAAPLPDNLFVWHFTITGPLQTDFHEGLYHGQIVLPKDYPFKPPEVQFMNENGRFEPNVKICLSITQYHPETWSAGISIRMMLDAIIAIFDDQVPGIGSVEASSDVRRKLAKDSHNYSCEKCGLIRNILKPRAPVDDPIDPINKQVNKQQESKKFIQQIPEKMKEEEGRREKKEIVQLLQPPKQEEEKKQPKPSRLRRIFRWFTK